jgi:hypothetical protein
MFDIPIHDLETAERTDPERDSVDPRERGKIGSKDAKEERQ